MTKELINFGDIILDKNGASKKYYIYDDYGVAAISPQKMQKSVGYVTVRMGLYAGSNEDKERYIFGEIFDYLSKHPDFIYDEYSELLFFQPKVIKGHRTRAPAKKCPVKVDFRKML